MPVRFRFTALSLAAAVALTTLATPTTTHANAFIYTGQTAAASVNPNDTQFFSVFNLNNSNPAYSNGQSSPVEVSAAYSASSNGSAVTGPSEDTTVNFGATASASAQAHAKHGLLKAYAAASADVRPGRQVVQYAGNPFTINSPLTAGSTGAIEVGYDDYITVSNPDLPSSAWVTLTGTLHLHAGIESANPSMANALAETTLKFFGTHARLDGAFYFNTSEITLTRSFSQGTWLQDDQHDVHFTIEVLNGVSFGIMQTLRVSATAGAAYNNDFSTSEVNALNTATLSFTPIGQGTQIQTSSGSLYLVPEPTSTLTLTTAALLTTLTPRRRHSR